MKFRSALLCLLLSAHAYAANTVNPQNQALVSVEYSSDGVQTGCGLRATGDTPEGLKLNILVTVFRKDTGATFGVIKVVARQFRMKNGAIAMEDGVPVVENLGRIENAWIRPDSGQQPKIDMSAMSSHNDAFMVNTEFSGTVDLLVAMARQKFSVGINRNDGNPDQVFRFDARLSSAESAKFSVCMDNLRAVMEESKHQGTF